MFLLEWFSSLLRLLGLSSKKARIASWKPATVRPAIVGGVRFGACGGPGGTGGIPTGYSQAKIGLALFDMEKDIGETTDVKAKHPNIVKHLQALGDKIRNELGDNGRTGTGTRPPGQL